MLDQFRDGRPVGGVGVGIGGQQPAPGGFGLVFALEVVIKDDALVEQYVSGSRTFYIMSNLDAITAVWSDGLFVETISGNLQIDEVKAIVDSIGG